MKYETYIVGDVLTNCYLVYDGDGAAALIDPGSAAPLLLGELERLGLRLEAILLTHGHFDHVGAVAELKGATGCRVVIHGADAPCLTEPGRALGEVPLCPPDQLAEDGDTVQVGGLAFTWLHTPGHTPGSCVLLCGDVMFSGDTLFYGDCGRCDLPGGDYQQMLCSLKRLHDLEGNFTVCPGHDERTTLDRERRENRSMREGVLLCGE